MSAVAHEATEGALLALIVDDQAALSVLAAWAALRPSIGQISHAATVDRLAFLAGVPLAHVATCLQRLLFARVLVDGGISELADRMLQTHVQSRLTKPSTKR